MIVMILERVPVSLRGELTRWLLEHILVCSWDMSSAMVRDRLWEKCCKSLQRWWRGAKSGQPTMNSALPCACMAKPGAQL